jgi:hypothetical protein
MSLRFWLLSLLFVATLASGCARRSRAKNTAATGTPAEAPRSVEEVRRENVRDLAAVMTEELQLRDEQTLRIRQVLATTVEQVNEAQTKFGSDKAGLTTALKRINATSESQLKQIMTSAQYQMYQQRKPQIQQKLREQKAAGN